jgi:hypothetical protein
VKKGIRIYALISTGIALEICVHAIFSYLLNSINVKAGGDRFLGGLMAIPFLFTLFNGILMTIAGIYLVLKGARQLG